MVDQILEEMKNKGYKSAILRKDGQMLKSNFQFEDPLPNVLASLINVSDALMKQTKSNQREFELSFGDSILVALPIKEYYLVSFVNEREQKRDLRDFAKQLGTKL